MPAERLARNGVISLAGSIVAGVGALVLTSVVGNYYGASATGLFFQAVGIFTVLTQSLRLGTGTGIVRSIAQERAFGRSGDEWRIVVFALVPVTVVALLCTVVLALLTDSFAAALAPDDSEPLRALIAAMVPFVAVAAVLGVLQSTARMVSGVLAFTLLQNVLPPAGRLVAVGVIAVAGVTAISPFEAWLLPLVVWLVVAAVVVGPPLIRDVRRRGSTPLDQRPRAGSFWRFTAPRAVNALLETALEWADVLIVAALTSPAAAGVYAVVTRVVRAGILVDAAARVSVAPTISQMLARQEIGRVSALHTRAVRALILIVWPFYLVLVTMGAPVLSVFGPDFSVGWGPMAVMAVGTMYQTASGMLQSIMLQGGHSSWQMGNKGLALALSVVGNLALVPVLGLWGAAITWLVVMLADNLLAAYLVHTRMGVRLQPRVLGGVAVVPLAVVGGGGALATSMYGGDLSVLFATAPVLGMLYLVVLWLGRRRLQIVSLWRRVPVVKKYA